MVSKEGHRGDAGAQEGEDMQPPFLGRWRNIYAVVLAELVILVILFYFFTKAFE
jgi:hypothetical protein